MALITNVNIGVTGNSLNGTNTSLFPNPYVVAKSYAYDEAQYAQTDPINLSLGATTLGTAAFANYTNKQMKSITFVPTTAETANDFIQIDLDSLAPQVFGTATATACIGTSTLAGTGFFGTTMGTGVNRVRICGIIGAGGTGIGGATGTQAFGVGTAVAFNPTYVNLAGATATIIVVSPAGTNTQAGYVFPTGVSGGVTLVPGDVVIVSRGTSSIGVYQLVVECSFTPGGNVTR